MMNGVSVGGNDSLFCILIPQKRVEIFGRKYSNCFSVQQTWAQLISNINGPVMISSLLTK